jgi:hypothetical protein
MAHQKTKRSTVTKGAVNVTKNQRAGRRRGEPRRDSINYPSLIGYGGQYSQRASFRPSTFNLRYFSRTPYVRRAIRALKNPITLMQWEITPLEDTKLTSELKRQIEVATNCFNHPNQDDSFSTLLELIIEDWAVYGAGCFEQQLSSDMIRPLWMWPVDSQSIMIFPGWSGDKNEARYLQTMSFNNLGVQLDEGILLRNDELVYIRANPANDTPYGFGPVQIAFNSISRQLGAAQYAGDVASNAQPENLLWLGKTDKATLEAFRAYWRNEIEGRGQTPILGSDGEPKAIRLHNGNDDALYLKYQEMLVREIATAFDLSPQNLGIERDVNRSQGEVAEDRDWSQAIKPLAALLQEYFTREVLHSKLGWYQLEFKFIGLDREDELNLANIFKIEYENNCITPNEYRQRKGQQPINNTWGDMVYADVQIAMDAARGASQVDDPNLKSNPSAQSNKDPNKSSNADKDLKENSQTK